LVDSVDKLRGQKERELSSKKGSPVSSGKGEEPHIPVLIILGSKLNERTLVKHLEP
jgi:hypothetical protein